jgi:hypothetical protein
MGVVAGMMPFANVGMMAACFFSEIAALRSQ